VIRDAWGYLPVAAQVGPAFYELVSGRYERRATVVTSNKSVARWGELIGGDTALLLALLDRLLHHGEVVYLRGAAYRMRGKEVTTFAVPSVEASTGNGLVDTGPPHNPADF